jgi:pseudaminic acid synthase
MDFLNSRNQGQVYIIAELSANHGNSLEVALRTVEAAKRAGADAIKLQTYTADSMTLDIDSPEFMANPNGPWAGKKLYDLYTEGALPMEWHQPIFTHAKNLGLDCLSSPFDIEAVKFLEQFNPPAYKIASFEITDIPLIKYAAGMGRPMIISTGVADSTDIELAIETCREVGNTDITILKCTSSYPAKPEDADLLTISDIAKRFDVIPGFSDHTLGIEAPVVAVTLGARLLEKHFILDKSIGGPDAHFSLDETEFTAMVKAVRTAEKLLGMVNYEMDEAKSQNRDRARSLYVSENVKAGDKLSKKNVKSIRPAKGLHPKNWDIVIGKFFKADYKKGTPLKLDFIE